MPDLGVDLGKLKLKNPVMLASGTAGFGREYSRCYDLANLGALVTKAVTVRPRMGNPPPRVYETPAGMLNAIGLENPGLEGFIQEELPFLQGLGCPVVVNIAGEDEEEYATLARRLDRAPGVAALEVNISCPNVKCGGLAFGVEAASAARVTAAVRRNTGLPVLVKLSPNVTDIRAIARAVEQAGADVISLINTLLGLAIDVQRRRPILGNVTGGLSGPAIRPVGVRMVWEVSAHAGVPVIGMGGILQAPDALEYLMAGASAVMMGTASFVDPRSPLAVVEGIHRYLEEHGMQKVSQLVGCAREKAGGRS
ncbi:MAG: dihydroorotate dehydrogenase [Bacillota bacterium]